MRPSICPLCEASCGIRVEVVDGLPVSVRGDDADPLSRGHLCPKATALLDLHADPDRLRHPVRRTATGWEPVGWDEALDDIARRLVALQRAHGNRALGLYLGNPNVHNLGQMTFAPMFWRTLGCTRFSATSVDQLPHHLAAFLMLGHQLLLPVPDLDHTDLFVVIGANPLVSNGSLMTAPGMRRRLDALRARGGKLVVVDPRRTETADRADRHLPIRPGTDAAWLGALVNAALAEGPADVGLPVVGLEALTDAVAPFTPERVAAFCGVPAEVTRGLARELRATPRAVVYARMGASTQSFGGLCQWLVIALNAITGHLDRPGGAMFTEPAFDPIHPPLGRGVGPGGFGRFRSRVRGLPEFAGELPASELATEILTPGEGKLHGLVVWAGNPVLSTPNGAQLDRALASLELMVAVDYYVTETSRHAHYVLPPVAPLARPHYDVVFRALAVRNTARWADPVVDADPDTRPDEWIVFELWRRVQALRGAGWRERLTRRVWTWLGPAGMVDLGLRFGRAKLSIRRLRREPHGVDLGPLRPCLVQRMTPGRPIDLAPAPYRADLGRLAEALDAPAPPLVLIGRRDTRSNNSWLHNAPRLMKGGSRFTLQIHPDDAARCGLVDGGVAAVRSRVGQVRARVELTDRMSPGVVSLPHGWGHDRDGVGWRVARAAAGASVNDLTDDARVDALTGNAAFTGTPVEVGPGD
ncbi:MAG: molybdopterin-dependent oxidoreductase [Myxococcota bacterium]